MTNYEAVLIKAKCENCGKMHEVLISIEEIKQYLIKKEIESKTFIKQDKLVSTDELNN